MNNKPNDYWFLINFLQNNNQYQACIIHYTLYNVHYIYITSITDKIQSLNYYRTPNRLRGDALIFHKRLFASLYFYILYLFELVLFWLKNCPQNTYYILKCFQMKKETVFFHSALGPWYYIVIYKFKNHKINFQFRFDFNPFFKTIFLLKICILIENKNTFTYNT